MAKSLLEEAIEIEKQERPELYNEVVPENNGTSDDGASGEVIPASSEAASDIQKPEDSKKVEEAEKPSVIADDAAALRAEIAQLKSEIGKEQSARGRLTVLAEENRLLKERIALLEAQKSADVPAKSDLSSEDSSFDRISEEYGEDIGNLFKAQKAEADALKKEISALKGDVDAVKGTASRSIQERFIEDLSTEVPDYETIRDKPEFAEFLQRPVSEFSRRTIYDDLKEAAETLDGKRTALIYSTFKRSTGQPQTDISEPPVKRSKERLIAPSSSARSETLNEKKPMTQDEINKTYSRIAAYKSKGEYKEADRLRAELDRFLESVTV